MAEYVRLRAPNGHGQILELPKLAAGAEVLESNQDLFLKLPSELNEVRVLARYELVELAARYTSTYLDAPWLAKLTNDDEMPIVMSGHQPALFHPGVWFKNFALSSLGEQVGGLSINLVVDNDLCSNANVRVPQRNANGSVKLSNVAFDKPFAAVPYEMRPIQSQSTFESFADSLSSAVSQAVDSPIIRSLWKEVLDAAQSTNSMPASLAAGRHRLEHAHGLKTLELPVSLLSSSRSFASFFSLLVNDAKRFASIHNQELADYRLQHRIRSRSHPVPDLTNDGQWQEVPFWIWTRDEPVRQRMFSKMDVAKIQLTDRQQWSVSIPRCSLVNLIQELNQPSSNVCIRPRALTTTMFGRIFASDVFIHGIGGAKYDQLNDDIIRQFFKIEPPEYFTTTATMKLPFEFQESTTEMLRERELQLRNARFHPEKFLPSHELVTEKLKLVQSAPISGSKKRWHDQIDSINQRLFQELGIVRERLDREIKKMKTEIPQCKILGSREYSFALFPEHLIQELKQIANQRACLI